jgi:DNA polymerase-1
MRYLTFTQPEKSSYPICFLVPQIQQAEMVESYVAPFGLNQEELLAITLHQKPGVKKTPKAEMVAYITEQLQPILDDMKVEYLLVSDAEYFKTFTKTAKADVNLGYVMDSAFGPQKVVYVPNYKAIFYDPDKIRGKIRLAIDGLLAHRAGAYAVPGADIIKVSAYPNSLAEIERWLVHFIDNNIPLTADIEAFALRHTEAGIGTISFAWNQHEGIAFAVDYGRPVGEAQQLRAMLKEFFRQHKAGITWHHIAYDVYVLVYQLFMSDILDTEGLLEGLDVMLDNWDCTKLISYLATNSCAGNKLGLKEQSQEFAGNYAIEEIKDITKVPLPQLLQYNLIDTLSTWYVKNKHYPTLLADEQEDIYINLFKKATKDIIQMQLTGLPVNMKRVAEVRVILEGDERKALDHIEQCAIIQEYTNWLNEEWVVWKNSTLKKKRVTLADASEKFNPNSGPQLQTLLYERLGLPVIAVTKSKQPSTDGDTLKALKNHTSDKNIIAFLDAMMDYNAVNKILTSFIPAMENAVQGPDGWYYLFGNFNLGGTLSGRLSSSNPNLQNLPATGSRYAKLIKSCFSAPPGWLFVGLDFDSLEDKISAVTTRDPNKLKVYTDGYDGHCLRAYAYFGENMPDIDPNNVVSINSIAKKYKTYRQDSKIPTFALTYMGTYITLMKNCGFPKDKAVLIEQRYHELYQVSDAWVAAKLDQAMTDGYVTVAFGLRVRTPLLKQVVRGNSKTPYEAEAEGRSAGNALGQSWCLLNSRAWVETMEKVRSSSYRLDIKPCAQIHDAGYALVRDNIKALKFLNDHLVNAVKWQDHPDIANDNVKLGGKLGVFFPDWTTEITLPNGASEQEIFETIDREMAA